MKDIVSYCLNPKVFKDFNAHVQEFSDLSALDSPVFFNGLALGETTKVKIADGKIIYIKFTGLSEPDEDNNRTVSFELDGQSREISIQDLSQGEVKSTVTMADPNNPLEIGAGIPGMVSKINVAEGDVVKVNEVLAIVEAMKMETTVLSKTDGKIQKIYVKQNQPIKAGELLISMEN